MDNNLLTTARLAAVLLLHTHTHAHAHTQVQHRVLVLDQGTKQALMRKQENLCTLMMGSIFDWIGDEN
jgi:hypothetical protein